MYEGDRQWRYRWKATLFTTFLMCVFEERFGDVWINSGSFNFTGLPKWTTERLCHMADSLGGDELHELAEKMKRFCEAVD